MLVPITPPIVRVLLCPGPLRLTLIGPVVIVLTASGRLPTATTLTLAERITAKLLIGVPLLQAEQPAAGPTSPPSHRSVSATQKGAKPDQPSSDGQPLQHNYLGNPVPGSVPMS